MSRWDFMRQLEELLSDISPNEREEALQYYNDYFNDAGRENEKEVMDALGSPEQVARIVKEGLNESTGTGEFTEKGFQSSRPVQNEVIKAKGNSGEAFDAKETDGNASSQESGADTKTGAKEKKSFPVWAIVLIVIGCILLSPVILSVILSAAGVLLGVIGALLGIIVGLGAASIALYIVAAVLMIAGFGCMLPRPVSGIGLVGGGLICGAIGILFMLLTVFIAGKCVPGICQGIAYIWKKLFGKKEGKV